MEYKRLRTPSFFTSVSSERKARSLVWRAKFGEEFDCPRCHSGRYYAYRCDEIRKCRVCGTHVRLRVGTLFEHSCVSGARLASGNLLVWRSQTNSPIADFDVASGNSALHAGQKGRVGTASQKTIKNRKLPDCMANAAQDSLRAESAGRDV